MQCFRVGYRGICHASLVFSVYTRAHKPVCIGQKYKWQVTYLTVSHEKALHNYFIRCLNLRKIYWNFRKLWKRFKPVVEEFYKKRVMKMLENLLQSSETFGKLRFKSVFQCSYDFLKFSENLRKSLEVFGNLREISGRDRKCLQWFVGVEEFRSWLLRSPQMDPSKLLRTSNDWKLEWNTTRCILQ